jgi:hypothetical protein
VAALVVLLAVAVFAGSVPANGADSGGAGPTPDPTTSPADPPKPPPTSSAPGSPFDSRGMWIWELPNSSGGSTSAIVAKARHYGIHTLFIKSSDGRNMWKQFTSQRVAALRAAGLKVCAWQYVYGSYPDTEAALGAKAKALGAQCLVIDAEGEYEGKYAAAQRYLSVLRGKTGAAYPVGLAGFPYNDYHPAYPYSVFLGPGGAQYNLPQMYWKAIGTTVDRVYSHTYRQNRAYGRAIAPLGMTYDKVRARDVDRFRLLARGYRAKNVSWWDWQEARLTDFHEIARGLRSLKGFRPDRTYATLASGSRGDLVVWAQQHLRTAGRPVPVDGVFGSRTAAAVKAFRAAQGLRAGSTIDTATWQSLLHYRAAAVRWKGTPSGARSASASGSSSAAPLSAHDPARRDEIPRKRH